MKQKFSFGAVAMFIVSLLCFSQAVFGQNCQGTDPNYKVFLLINNPSPYLADWQSRANTAVVEITNFNGPSADVKITAEIELNGQLVAYTQFEKLPVRTLQQGTHTYFGGDIVPLSAVHFENTIDQSTQRAGRIPDGQVCITVKLVSATDPTKILACDKKCATIISYSAPILIVPQNDVELCKLGLNGVIDKSNGQPRPIFTWTTTVPVPATFPVVYHFAIFEVVPGMEPLAAFRGGRPLFTQNLIGITQLMWPTGYFLPEVGKRYMWSVRPLDEKGLPLVTTNDGWAVPHYFNVTSDCDQGRGPDTDGDGLPNFDVTGNPINNKGNSIKALITQLGTPLYDVSKGQTLNGVGTSNSQPLKYRWFARVVGYPIWTPLCDYQNAPTLFVQPNTFQAGGSYQFQFVVLDSRRDWATDWSIISVGGQNTSLDITIPAGNSPTNPDIDAFETFYRNFKANHRNGHIAIELDGTHSGWIFNAEDGYATSDIVEGQSLPTFKKHIGNVKYEDISFKCGAGMSKGFYEWIQASFDKKHNRKNGAVIFCDFDYKELSRLNFFQALTTEIGMPALDAASKGAAKMTIKIKPEYTKFSVADSGKDHSRYKLDGKIQKKWTTSSFRLKLDGFDDSSPWSGGPSHGRDEPSRQYVKVEAMTMSQKLMEDTYEETKKTGSSAIIPKLTIIFDSTFAQAAAAWHDKLMLDRKNNVLPKKTGTLTYLADDKTELFTVDFTPIGIPPICNNKFETGANGIRRLRAEMYCEDVRFTSSSVGADDQTRKVLEQAAALHDQLLAHAQPAVRSWITDEAAKISRDPKATDLTIRNDIEQRFAGQDLSGSSKEALEFLVSTEALLKEKMDSLSDLSETTSLQIQKAQERRDKMFRILSNMMKKNSDTQAGLIANLK